jgi:secondary thiamine-phosphate synthase enzyme
VYETRFLLRAPLERAFPPLSRYYAYEKQTGRKRRLKLGVFFGGIVIMSAGVCHLSGAVSIETRGEGFYGVGRELQCCLSRMRAGSGLLSVFCTHTSASLCIQENADPDVLTDLGAALRKLAPETTAYRHQSEGPDDMPAHIKTMLTATQLSLPVRNGRLALGTWQEVYLIEHRAAPHHRRLELDFVGSAEG